MPARIKAVVSRSVMRLLFLSSIGFPFSVHRPRSAVDRARRFAWRERVRDRAVIVRVLLTVLVACLWPVGALVNTVWSSRAFTSRRWSRAHRMYVHAVRFNVPPVEYVIYGLDRPGARGIWPDYLRWSDVPLFRKLNRARRANEQDVQDKRRFAEICAARGYPHVAALEREQLDALDDGAELWLKLVDGLAGSGAETWRRIDGGFAGRGAILSPDGLWQHAMRHRLLIQPRLRNHPRIEPLTNGALASLRVVTACHRDGHVSFLGNMLLLPREDRIHSGGGAGFAVDWLNGRVVRALPNVPQARAAAVVSTALPFWSAALRLVSRAHREAFSSFATLGWDIALTPDGPLLLETNAGWGVVEIQQLWGPLGRTPFTRLLHEELGPGRT